MDAPAQRRLAIAGQELRPLGRIGEGTYACVILASISNSRPNAQGATPHRPGGGLIAVKIWKSKSSEIVRLAKREVVVHTRLNGHPNIVHLRGDYRSGGGRPILLMEYCPRDLQSELRLHPAGLPGATVKLLAWQLVQAFRFMHAERLLHRDLKPANLLLTADGILKVGDFGLAREAPLREPRTGEPGEALTQYVVTRWYRAPEVLLNRPYGTAADIWSVGCTIAEMAIGTPLLPGDSSVDQIFQVWRTFGGLPQRSASTGAGVAAKSSAAAAPPRTPMQRSSLRARLSTLLEEPLLELLEAALRTDPHERATAEDLIRMPYFDEIPELVAGTELESLYDWSTGAGAAAPPAAAAARAVSLQASELDLPASKPTQAEVVADSLLPPPSAPAPSATADWQAYALAAAAAAAAARRKDDAALAVRPAAVVSPVLRMQAAVEALTVPEPGGGGGGGAATAIGQLGGEDTGDTFPGGSRCTVRMEEQQQQAGGGSVGKEHDQDYEWGFRGGEGRESGELGQSALALLQGSNGADPRVGNSKAPTGAMHRVSSLPVLDKVGAENPRNDLRRTTSMGLAARRQLAGGGGGGRQMRARTAGRAGAALSLCNFLAQGQVPSGLSNWCESHWELATASESDAAPMQEAATGSVTQGRPWATSSNTTATIPEDEPLVEPQTQQQRLSQLGGPSPDAAELPVKCLLPSLSPATAATAAATAAAATATAAAAAAAAAAEVRALCGRRQRQLPSACEATAPSAPADAFLGRGGTTRSDRGPAVLDGGGGGAASAAMAAAVSRGDDVVASAAAADVVLSGTGLTMPLAPKECDVVGGDAGGGGGDGGAGDGRDMTPICVRSSLVNSAPDVLSPDAGLGVDGGEHRAPVHKVLSVVGREAGGPTCAADVDGGGGGGCGSLRLPPAEAEAVAEIEASSASPARRDGGRWAGGSETADSAAAAPAVNSASRSDDPRPCKPSVYDDSTATYDVTTGDGPLDAVDTCISIFTAGIVSQSHGVCANKAPEEAGGAGQRGKAGKGWQQDGGREKQRAPQRECERAVQDP